MAGAPQAACCRAEQGGITLFVRLTPGAARDALGGLFTDAEGKTYLNIHIRAAPEKGQANKALLKFLSKMLKPAGLGGISLERGGAARFKQLRLCGDSESLRQKLAEMLQTAA